MSEISVPPPPARPDDAHKGTFGTVGILGGSPTMLGAPALAATAALRSGCGLVRILTDADLLPHCIGIEPSATGMALPEPASDADAFRRFVRSLDERLVLAVGPGMGQGDLPRQRLREVLTRPLRTVVDADGLNNLSEQPELASEAQGSLVLTPHPGEFRRLASPWGIDRSATDPDQRPDAAAALANALGAVVALKGRGTVVSDGARCSVNTTGNPALSTAGTGDVLTGMIASFIAQGLAPFDATVLAVHLHGHAADRWAERHGRAGLTARDLAGLLPLAIEDHRRRCG